MQEETINEHPASRQKPTGKTRCVNNRAYRAAVFISPAEQYIQKIRPTELYANNGSVGHNRQQILIEISAVLFLSKTP